MFIWLLLEVDFGALNGWICKVYNILTFSAFFFWKDYVATRWYRAPELCGSFFSKVSFLLLFDVSTLLLLSFSILVAMTALGI